MKVNKLITENTSLVLKIHEKNELYKKIKVEKYVNLHI